MADPNAIRVYETSEEAKAREERMASGKPAHWVDIKASAFTNPWPSWQHHGGADFFRMILQFRNSPRIPRDIAGAIPVRKPTFGLEEKEASENRSAIKATWLGHACFLLELPARSVTVSRGARILFDPVFSDRCSPSQLIGPKRYTPPPCEIESIPEVDAIVISVRDKHVLSAVTKLIAPQKHNHYDHMDTHTLRTLFRRERKPHIFAPLGNAAYFHSLGILESHTHILDWWQSRRVETEVPSNDSNAADTQRVAFNVTCTPAQHFTGRGVLDRFKSLWASWVVEEIVDSGAKQDEPGLVGVKAFFGGDTGYRAVLDTQNEDEVPHCPAFKEIGERFGGFDLAMIPIGAYLPRWFMSPIHCAPQDSVRLFKDIQAKRALGMHWGTWVLTIEDVTEPPRRLAEECKKLEIEEGAFSVCDIGETRFF